MVRELIDGDTIELRKGVLVVVRKQVLALGTIDDLQLALAASGEAAPGEESFGRLPKGTVFLNVTPTMHTFIIEREPDLYAIKTEFMRRPLRLAMPWQYFLLRVTRKRPNVLGVGWGLDTSYLFWSPKRLTTLRNPPAVLAAMIPNISQENASICFGNTMPDSNLPLYERLDNIVDGFYAPESTFNGDLHWNMPRRYQVAVAQHAAIGVAQPFDHILRGYSTWATESRQDKTVFLKWEDWREPVYPFRNMTAYIMPEEGGGLPQFANQPNAENVQRSQERVVRELRQRKGVTSW